MTLLWLDDIRNPYESDWIVRYAPEFDDRGVVHWVMNYEQFTQWIRDHGLPDKICFDNDLGENQKEGRDCVNWLIDYCLDNNLSLPDYAVQSDNTPAKEYMLGTLNNFRDFISKG